MSFDFNWCRCSEQIWPHWHVNPDDVHDIKVFGEDDDDDSDAGQGLLYRAPDQAT